MADSNELQPSDHRRCHPWMVALAIVAASLAVFAYALNWTSPWESDESGKAAQVMVVAETNDYFLSSVPDYYKVQLFPLYFVLSALLYKVTGGPIFTFMNLSSVVMGTVTVLSIVYALRNALGIRPLWSTLVVLAMPLLVTTSTYGNEVSWSFAFFSASLWLLTAQRTWIHYAGAAALACSIYCRPDMVLVVPFAAIWALLFSPCGKTLRQKLVHWVTIGVAFGVAMGVLWLALLRTVPDPHLAVPWETNLKLVAAFLVYPFNPSLVLLGAIGGIFLWRSHRWYAIAHFLLLAPVVFYANTLCSPKYIIVLVLFYGIPAALLLQRVGPRLRACCIAAVLIWMVVSVSPLGVYGPSQGSLWYVPTADGPTPTGAYLNFFHRARQGFYQTKQWELLSQTRQLTAAADAVASDVRLIGQSSSVTLPYVVMESKHRGDPEPAHFPPQAQEGDDRGVMGRIGYLDLPRYAPEWMEPVRRWLENGQVRPVPATDGQVFPAVIEVGEQVPAGTNPDLGRRILFMVEYYDGRKAFQMPQFIAAYRATCWVPADQSGGVPPDTVPIYKDDQYLGYDVDVPGGEVYSMPWPARYYRFRPPRSHQ